MYATDDLRNEHEGILIMLSVLERLGGICRRARMSTWITWTRRSIFSSPLPTAAITGKRKNSCSRRLLVPASPSRAALSA